MVLGQPSGTLIDYRINPFRSLTGERALLKKDIVPILSDIWDIRFGVETFINLYYQTQGKEIALTLMNNYDLMVQRIELLIKKSNTRTIKKINTLQIGINNSLKKIKDKFY